MMKNVLLLPFIACFAVINLFGAENARKLDITRGLTISATVKLAPRKPITGSGFDSNKEIIYHHDIIASRGRDFVFGRRADLWVDQLYFNFYDGTKWAVSLDLGAKTPAANKWAVWSVTAAPFYVREEGRKGTVITFFLNGEPVHKKEVSCSLQNHDTLLQLREGVGIHNDTWGFNGQMEDFFITDRALNEEELLKIVKKNRRVKINIDALQDIPEKTESALKAFVDKSNNPYAVFAASALIRNGKNGGDLAILQGIASRLKPICERDLHGFVQNWNAQVGSQFPLLQSDGVLVMLNRQDMGGSPLVGFYDIANQRDLLGKRLSIWELSVKDASGESMMLASNHFRWKTSELRHVNKGQEWDIIWQLQDRQLEVQTHWRLAGKRLCVSMNIRNNQPKQLLNTVQFPKLRIARLDQGQDYLVHPRQSGLLYSHPTTGGLPGGAYYPTGWLNMQFGAYYDGKSGLYWSPEDKTGKSVYYSVTSRGGELEVSYRRSIGYGKDAAGGNSYSVPGQMTLELFSGDWFDAAQCYKRFARTAGWWHREVPRRDTPEWYRENTLNVGHWTFTEQSIKLLPNELQQFRKYLGLPYAVHWYRWYDSEKYGGMPHFKPKSGVLEAIQALKNTDIALKPYIDTRLWSELDGPGHASDLEFQKYGKRFAVKNLDGSMNYERYHAKCREVVMCAGCTEWQDWFADATCTVAGYGFNGIYHDQVAASKPIVCYDATHGHLLNSTDVWVQGYYQMFVKIREKCSRFPLLAHETEDAADAYIRNFDGMLPWRWTDPNGIPLFVSVYAGQVQFVGREFNNTTRGDDNSFFVKYGQQLVQAEQIGWFTISDLKKSAERSRFAKQLAHTRKLLLPYFNEGEMQRPLVFKKGIPSYTTLWGCAATKPHAVTLPQVLHSVWKHPQRGTIALFVNTGTTPITINPEWEDIQEITLAPHEIAVLCQKGSSDAKRIADGLKAIHAFTPWTAAKQVNLTVQFKDKENVALPLGSDCLDVVGNGQFLFRKIKFPKEKNVTYTLTGQCRKAGQISSKPWEHAIVIGTFDAKHTFHPLETMAAFSQSDNIWRDFKATVQIPDGEVDEVALFIYNSNSKGTVSVRNLEIMKK